MNNNNNNEEKNEMVEFKQHGIIYASLTKSGQGTNASVKVDYEEVGNNKLYCSGSVKNESTATTFVRLSSINFNNGYADIPLTSGEIVKFKNIRLDIISIPSIVGQSTTINVKVVAITYSFAMGEPEIDIE